MSAIPFNKLGECTECGSTDDLAAKMCRDCWHWNQNNADGKGETRATLAWFLDLQDMVQSDDLEIALTMISGAIKLYERELNESSFVH